MYVIMKIKLFKDVSKSILTNNLKREHNTLSKYACLSNMAIRKKEDSIPDRENIRQAFFHDTDKIMHSDVYTRYIDKTQVFYLFENDHITHRVLHVQLVSKIARVIGRALKLNEDLIEAISLAHDLGHVPYGHNGERRINKLINDRFNKFFCHNAQSVRSLMFLENNGKGLNLTLQVLDGVLCHNGELLLKEYKPKFSKNWDDFIQEYNKCWLIKDYSKKLIPMTLEGCVMRISDIIAYLGRDLEDAITLGVITRKSIPSTVTKFIGNRNSDIINTIVLDLINNSYNKDYLKLSEDIYKAIDELYSFSISEIYQNPKITVQDNKINYMFDFLFNKYLDDIDNNRGNTSISTYFLKDMPSEYIENNENFMIVVDYIASMTDKYFNNQFKESVMVKSFGRKAKTVSN